VNNDRVAQLYGYSVCLIAVVTLLFSIPPLVGQALSLNSDDTQSYEPSVQTFAAYKATRNSQSSGDGLKAKSNADLRTEYEAVRAARLSAAHAQTARAFVTSTTMVVLALVLFLLHWRWLRERALLAEGTLL